MNTEDETILDDLFLGCALTAFLQVAMDQGAMPDSEKTRRRAYDLYEETLPRQKHGHLIAKAGTMTTNDTNTISVGDQVGYRARDGDILGNDRGKVLGIFRTRDGKTLADVEWEKLGMPKRASVERLVRIVPCNR